jgi:hypothetical protein
MIQDPPAGWTWLGYRRWWVSLRGQDLRGRGPRPLMDQRYRVLSCARVASPRGGR